MNIPGSASTGRRAPVSESGSFIEFKRLRNVHQLALDKLYEPKVIGP